jgi:hypothetical protein
LKAVAAAVAVAEVQARAVLQQQGQTYAYHVHAANKHSREALVANDLQHLALLALIFAGHDLHLIAPNDLPAAC